MPAVGMDGFREKLRMQLARGLTRSMTTTPRLVAVCQMTSTNDLEKNFETGKTLIEAAKKRNAEMVFLPECFDFIGRHKDETLALAQEWMKTYLVKYLEMARSYGLWLSLGGFHDTHKRPSDDKVWNTHAIVNSSGQIVSQYHKLHLFDLDMPGRLSVKETDMTHPGKSVILPVETPVGRVGISTCYDLRFPELGRILRDCGAEVLTYPSAFTVPTGQAHWESLLRARAIENQCYVVAAAQVGTHNEKRASYGHAMVVDPWGVVRAQAGPRGPDMCVVEIDLEYAQTVRKSLPCHSHIRKDVYRLKPVHEAGHSVTSPPPCKEFTDMNFGHVVIPKEHIFLLSNLAWAFVNHKPVVPGHVLIATKRKVAKFTDMSSQETADFFTLVQRVQRALEVHFGTQSSTLAMQDGVDSGQTIAHCHIHILPRRPGDFANNDTVYEELAHHDHDSRKPRSFSAMEEEAARFRTLFAKVLK